MKAFFEAVARFFAELFAPAKLTPNLPPKLIPIGHIPKFQELSTEVSIFQRALLNAGFDPGPIDGHFGVKTKDACSRFQKSVGLPGSGEPGSQTIARLGLTLSIEPEPTEPLPTGKNYAPLSWEKGHAERRPWSDWLIQYFDQNLEAFQKAQDIKKFRPDWDSLTRSQRVNVLAELICAICYPESGWNPLSRMHEKSMGIDPITGDVVYSEGLLQLSYQDIQWAKPCRFDWSKDKSLPVNSPKKTILDPIINLECGVGILKRQIENRGSITLSSGVYWAVLKIGGTYTAIDSIAKRVQAFKVLPADSKPSEPPVVKPPTTNPGDVTTLTSHPAMDVLLPHKGKKETDPAFNKWMSSHWYLAKLKSNTIATSTWAWCMVFVITGAFYTGYQYYPSGLAAHSAQMGVEVKYKTEGAGRGSVVHKQSPSGQNHTCYLNGNCTAKDLTCPGCTFDCFGGNQNDAVSVATYPVSQIKAIRWLTKADGTGVPKPGRIVKSINCTSGSAGNESTR